MAALSLPLAFIAGVLVTLIGRPLLTERLVRLLGRDRFAPPDTLEGCSPALFTGAVSAIVALFADVQPVAGGHPGPLTHHWGAVLATPILLGLAGTTAYSLLWLYSAAGGVRGRQFTVENGEIRRLRDGARLSPAWAGCERRFVQSDAFHSSWLYALVLYDRKGAELARNGHSTEASYRAERAAVLAASGCVAVDLVFVWRERPLEWLHVRMEAGWASVLWQLRDEPEPAASLAVWRPFILPILSPDGRILVGREQLAALAVALPPPDIPEGGTPDDHARLRALLERLPKGALVEAMTSARFDAELTAATGPGGSATFNADQDPLRIRLTPPKGR